MGINLGKIRVLVVDDSAVVRMALRRILDSSGRIEVVGAAGNGEEAIGLARELRPDVITLDVEMPVMNGLETLRALAGGPWRVVMVSSYTTRGAETTIKALEAGAVDYVAKPSRLSELDSVSSIMISKIEGAAASKAPGLGRMRVFPEPPEICSLLLVGASTGGPRAILRLLSGIKKPLPWPTIIAVHMLPGFTGPFARHITDRTGHPATEAGRGMRAEPGVVYIAPGGKDLILDQVGDALYLYPDDPQTAYSPSVDRLFDSAARARGSSVLALVLTGMGQDGLAGARALKEAGGTVWAQDEESSVVWGMPGAIVKEGIARAVASPEEMAFAIERMRGAN